MALKTSKMLLHHFEICLIGIQFLMKQKINFFAAVKLKLVINHDFSFKKGSIF